MKAARFSLAALLLWMALIAAGCQALVSHTPMWTHVVVTATVALFGLALLMALTSSGTGRAYLLSFALAGGGYVLLAVHPLLAHMADELLTTRVLMVLWRDLGDESQAQQAGTAQGWALPGTALVIGGDSDYEEVMGGGVSPAVSRQARSYYRTKRSYLLIGQCLWAVLLAFPIGLFCAWQYERRLRREQAKVK